MTPARRWLPPVAAFAAVLTAHFVWHGTHPECAPGAGCSEAACAPPPPTWIEGYVDGAWYWLGLSYAASAAYAVAVVGRAVARRAVATTAGAAPGLALSALLPFVGCWLVGCCGSPLLPVYLNLLGAAFLPIAKPLVAGLTVVMLTLSWVWMLRRERAASAGTACAPGASCECA
jgi:hypothetical protein